MIRGLNDFDLLECILAPKAPTYEIDFLECKRNPRHLE